MIIITVISIREQRRVIVFLIGKLDLAFAQEIVQKLVSQRNAEWEGKEKTRCLIIWRTPDEWADLVYKWVSPLDFLLSSLLFLLSFD